MIPRKLDRILADCLSRMDRGESLNEILAAYPELEEKIKPLLLVAMLSRALPPPVPGYTALRLGKNELLAEMATMQAEGAFLEPKPIQPARDRVVDRLADSLRQLQPAYRIAMMSLVIILAGGFFTLSASASGLADDVFQTLFYSFEQVGDLLLVKPAPPRSMGDNAILSSNYELPESLGEYSGSYKALNIEEDGGDEGLVGSVDPAELEARMHTFVPPAELEEELAALEIDEGVVDDQDLDVDEEIIDDKDLEKEEKEDLKDLEQEEKEDEKEADKEEKEADKEADKAEKDADKEEKEDDKDKD